MRKQKGQVVKGGRRKEEIFTLLLDLSAYWEENFLSANIPLVFFPHEKGSVYISS